MRSVTTYYNNFSPSIVQLPSFCQTKPLVIFLLCISSFLYGDPLYDEALAHFFDNNPKEAAILFQSAIKQGNVDPDTYIHLAYSYEQLGLYDEGIETLLQGLEGSRGKRYLFHFNLGNLYLQKEEPDRAIEQYNFAIGSRSGYADAYLNRANTYLNAWELNRALADYQSFIRVASEHELVPDVKRMIQAITGEIQAEEARKIEEQRLAEIEAERQRIETLEAEKRAAEETARQQAFLDEILGNLESAGNEDQSLGAGTEDISTDEDDFSRAD